MELKYLFAKGTPNFINGTDDLLNNDPKNPPDWIILGILALESFKSVDIFLLKAFLSFVFYCVANNNSWGRLFPSNIFKLILRVVPILFLTAVFRFFNDVSVNFTFTLLYSTIYTNYKTFVVPLENCKVVSFHCSRM